MSYGNMKTTHVATRTVVVSTPDGTSTKRIETCEVLVTWMGGVSPIWDDHGYTMEGLWMLDRGSVIPDKA
jgi:hypothetical protein